MNHDFQLRYEAALESVPPEKIAALEAIDVYRRRLGFGSSHTVVLYPPLARTARIDSDRDIDWILTELEPSKLGIDLYLHNLFCEWKCQFCHYATSRRPHQRSEYQELAQALIDELDLWWGELKNRKGSPHLRSIYLGGGTGFLLDPKALEYLLRRIRSTTSFDPGQTHFCVETSNFALCEEDASQKLDLLLQYGMDRVSIGVQSVNGRLLQRQARSPHFDSGDIDQHHRTASEKAVHLVSEKGITNINIDLMQDISEGHSADVVAADLDWFLKSRVPSLTYYITRYLPGSTGFAEFRHKDPDLEHTRTSAATRLAIISRLMDAGYTPGPGCRFSLNNQIDPYKQARSSSDATLLGVGPSAYSRFGQVLFANSRKYRDWKSSINNDMLATERAHRITKEERNEGRLINAIRNGATKDQVAAIVRKVSDPGGTEERLRNLCDAGLLNSRTGTLALTDLGRAFEEEIAWLFFSPINKTAAQDLLNTTGRVAL